MSKKGFTLIELLAVIIIISLLTILVLPKITNAVKNYTKKTDALMLTMIEDAAKLYLEDNIDSLEENEYGYYCVPLTELVNNNYLKEGIELSGKDATYTKSLKINYNEDNKIEIVDKNKCMINSETTVLAAGLYDENDVLLASWDELIDAGLDVETDLSSSDSRKNMHILDGYGDSYKLVIDDSVTKIGDNAFYGSGLINVVIPNSVLEIGTAAFFNNKLTTIMIPSSVTSIESQVLGANDYLTKILVDENNSVYDSRDNSNAIIETASNTLIAGCANTIIPNSVTKIGDYAFVNCQKLINITIPSSVTKIGDYAFARCWYLKNITIPDSVTVIGSYAFESCWDLTSIHIPSSVNSIYSNAFFGCTGLTSITISDGVKSIGNDAFRGCAISSIVIPKSVKSIGHSIFASCSNLTSVVIDENNSVYDSRDNSNAIIETATNTLTSGCKNTIIPNSVTKIGDYAFFASSLTNMVIPSSVTSIGYSAFHTSRKLESITIPNSVESIGSFIFTNCDSLTSIYYSGTATGSPWGATNATIYPNE